MGNPAFFPPMDVATCSVWIPHQLHEEFIKIQPRSQDLWNEVGFHSGVRSRGSGFSLFCGDWTSVWTCCLIICLFVCLFAFLCFFLTEGISPIVSNLKDILEWKESQKLMAHFKRAWFSLKLYNYFSETINKCLWMWFVPPLRKPLLIFFLALQGGFLY